MIPVFIQRRPILIRLGGSSLSRPGWVRKSKSSRFTGSMCVTRSNQYLVSFACALSRQSISSCRCSRGRVDMYSVVGRR